ncbi:creatininase family protein, partial [Escherichia coli]|uniref:creatininase family protein n=1 Tax=Escherichia coli TaxID=562 RepID=UPI001953D6DA
MSEHHFPFGGTISVDFEAYRAIVHSIVRSLKSLGFARLLLVNGHGGNIDPLAVIARELAVTFACRSWRRRLGCWRRKRLLRSS